MRGYINRSIPDYYLSAFIVCTELAYLQYISSSICTCIDHRGGGCTRRGGELSDRVPGRGAAGRCRSVPLSAAEEAVLHRLHCSGQLAHERVLLYHQEGEVM